MWTWPLDSAIEATTAHRVSEGVADGTCTQVWAWMTNKCRKRMNQRKGYIISEICHKGGGLGSETRREFIFSDEESSPPRRWAVWFCSSLLLNHPQFLHKSLPHQSPAFGPTLYKFIVLGPLGLDPRLSLGPARKSWPYNWRRLWEELLVRWWVQRFVKEGSSPLREAPRKWD